MHTLISAKPSSTSSLVSAMPSMPATFDRLAHQHGVEPAAAALAPGHGAELVAALAERSPISSWSSVGNGPAPTRVV